MAESGKSSLFLSTYEGMIIAATPAAAYGFSLLYEIGFGEAFGFPQEIMNPTFFTLILTFGSLLVNLVPRAFLIVAVLHMICNGIFAHEEHAPIRRRFVWLFPLICLFVLVLIAYGRLWRESLGLAYLILGIAFYEFVFPLAIDRRPAEYLKVLSAYDEEDPPDGTLFGRLRSRLGAGGVVVVISMVVAGFAFYHYGRASGLSQQKFLVASFSPELAVLRVYGDRMICAPFDRKSRTLYGPFSVRPFGDTTSVQYRVEDIGPLSVSTH